MAEPLRVLHFADAHIGMENYGRLDPETGTSSRVRDFLDRLDEVIDFAILQDGDLAVFAGDAFKNRDPEPTQQREFAQRMKRLADHMPTLLLVGNHDMPGMAAKASSVDIFQALDVPGVIVGHKAEGRVVETRRGPVYLAWIPYPMRNRLLTREEHAGKTIEQLEAALRQTVSEVLAGLAEEARSQPMPRLLAGHLSVAEARLGSERTVMLGRDVAVLTSTLNDTAWDYVALGHIHKHQVLNPGGYPQVVYSGSLERIDFGEEDEPKGFCWVELARGSTRWSFQPVAARPFRTVTVDVRSESDPTAAVVRAASSIPIDGAIVRVLVTLRVDQQAQLREREIEAALEGANNLTISRLMESEARARLGEAAFETLTPLQLVEQYFRGRGVKDARVESLLQRAEELVEENPPAPTATGRGGRK
ncbi:MAG TPA: exonuclease SbcCD subunit D [Anaerolineales bacterium]|nr:exonuclease SbcCD subunit D [Anaerolineales bacterium]